MTIKTGFNFFLCYVFGLFHAIVFRMSSLSSALCERLAILVVALELLSSVKISCLLCLLISPIISLSTFMVSFSLVFFQVQNSSLSPKLAWTLGKVHHHGAMTM